MKEKVKTTTTITKEVFREYNAQDLRRALGVAADAEIYVWVPGGGDWSDTRLDIGSDSNLLVMTTQTTTEER